MQGALILITAVGYVIAAFLWPTLRVWRRHGIWPVVFARQAAPAQRAFGWLTRALFIVIVGASAGRFVFGAEPLGICGAPAALQVSGWLLIASGALLTIVAQRQMGASWRVGIDDRPTGLVQSGLFQVVRNPVFSGLLLFLGGYACLSPAWWSLLLFAATAAVLRVQVLWEEQHLIAQHGATWFAYAARVGRFFPWMGRLRSQQVAR